MVNREDGRRPPTRAVAAVIMAMTVVLGCSETDPAAEAPAEDPSTESTAGSDGSVVSRFGGSEWFMGTVPAEATAADSSLEPVRIGFINTDSGPIAALPELHQGTDAAIAFINAELGGIDGHPLELVPCQTDLSPESAQACARSMVSEGVPVVLGGLSISSDAAVAVLEDNGIGWIGGLPLNQAEMTSDHSIQFSGGSPSAFAAFADHAAHTVGAETASVLYANVPQIAAAATDYGVALLEDFGVDVTQITFDLSTQDYATIATKADESDPDVIVVGAADAACSKVMEALDAIGSDATVYMVGSCADPKWIDAVGSEAVAGTIFNIEGRFDQSTIESADNDIYLDAIDVYGEADLNAAGAATVAFRSTMNLYSVLDELGADGIDAASILETFHAARDRPNFDGHAYTCDGRQIPELPSMCSPQQVLIEFEGPTPLDFVESSDGWIDVPAVLDER